MTTLADQTFPALMRRAIHPLNWMRMCREIDGDATSAARLQLALMIYIAAMLLSGYLLLISGWERWIQFTGVMLTVLAVPYWVFAFVLLYYWVHALLTVGRARVSTRWIVLNSLALAMLLLLEAYLVSDIIERAERQADVNATTMRQEI